MQIVSSTAVFLKMMILCRELAVQAGLYISPHSEGLPAHFSEFREAVAVMVISVLLPVLAEDGKSHLVVLCDYRCIERGVVIEGGSAVDAACSMGYGC